MRSRGRDAANAATGRTRARLPRVGHADDLRPGETVLRRSAADLRNGWLARHGRLCVTEERMLFLPTPLDRLLGAKRREASLGEISQVERYPSSPDQPAPGARRPRMRVHTAACVYEFVVGDVDTWIDSLERVYQLRRRRGAPHTPRFTREGYINLLLTDD